MDKKHISNEEVEALLAEVKSEMSAINFPSDIVDGTRIVIIHPEYWEISLLVPYKSKYGNVKSAFARKAISTILFEKCGANPEGCDYFGKQEYKQAYEWYFRHPNIPQDVNDLIEAEIEANLGGDIGIGLPSPSRIKSRSDTAFMTLTDKYFREIESGMKTTEYRNLNQYYCDKLFPNGIQKKFIRFNRGYMTGLENQMVFEISSVVLVSEKGDEIPALDDKGKVIESYGKLPRNFAPSAYGIKLGRRVK